MTEALKTKKNSKINTANLKALFEPRAIAVIGASRKPEAVGYAVMENLLTGGYQGKVFPVNPKADEIQGYACYKTIASIPENFDLAVIVVNSQYVPAAIEQCAEKGVKAAIVISAGFKEIGEEGRQIEEEVKRAADEHGIAVLGPNCLGLINTDPRFSMNASFSRNMPRSGNIAFVSQSGALCTAALDYSRGVDVGFAKFISLGNKAVINEIDILRYLEEDDQTAVIMMYLEDIADGRRFIEVARKITGDSKKTKPILVIKSGRTLQGCKAAQSHTGSLMGSDEVYDAIFAQGGVLRMESVKEMFEIAEVFSKCPPIKGNRVAIVTNAGGPGIMATDACVRQGLQMTEFSEKTMEALRQVLPPTANIHNPIDVIGDARHDRYEDALKIIANGENVDSIIVILTPQAMTDIEEIAKVIVKVNKEISVPLIACFMGIVDVSAGVKILEQNHVVHYRFPEEPAKALAAMAKTLQWINRPRTVVTHFEVDHARAENILRESYEEGKTFLTIDKSMEVLAAYGFPVLPYAVEGSPEEAAEAAEKIGYPVAVKAVSQDIIHKVDVGGVRLKLQSKEQVRDACADMEKAISKKYGAGKVEGFFVQKMAGEGKEVILGMNVDPNLGPTLMFGLGGIYVEAVKDVTFRLAPIRKRGAKIMIESIRAYKILKGVRGDGPVDFKAIEEALERLSQLSCEHPLIQEIDMNPLIVHPEGQGASVVDARFILRSKPSS